MFQGMIHLPRWEKTMQPIFLTSDLIDSLQKIPPAQFPLLKEISLTLGVSKMKVNFLSPRTFIFNQQEIVIPFDILKKNDARSILIFEKTGWRKWQVFDERTHKFYKMIYVAPGTPPTIEISGIKMHITQDGDPARDTIHKIKCFKFLKGKVLDTCTELGYTAIASARQSAVNYVYTCERDLTVHHLSRQNPWSQLLFTDPKIKVILIPVQQLASFVPSEFFDAIIHDPPRFSLAPELYNSLFYQDLYRILKKGGELYHYTGDPQRKTRRSPLAVETQRRLKEIGFRSVKLAYRGVIAQK